LPKVLSSYPLSPQRGERARVRGEKKKLLPINITTKGGMRFAFPPYGY
jgi:hypothetical protein